MYQQCRALSAGQPASTSPAASIDVNSRLDDLFQQLKMSLTSVDTDELVNLLEDMVDRVDSRMVARYGHGMRPCPTSTCQHQHESCGLSPNRQKTEAHVSCLTSTNNSTRKETKENAKYIVMNAVMGAFGRSPNSETQPKHQATKDVSATTKKSVTTKSRPAGTGNVLSNIVRQPGVDYRALKDQSTTRPRQGADVPNNRDKVAMQTITAGEFDSNRTFALRREARCSLAKYANSKKVDVLLNAMHFDEHEEEDDYHDAKECQVTYQSSGNVANLKPKTCKDYSSMHNTPDSLNSTPRKWMPIKNEVTESESIYKVTCDDTNDTYSKRSEFNRSAGKFSTPGKQGKTVLMGVFDSIRQISEEDVFPIEPTTPCKTFRRVFPPRVLKEQAKRNGEQKRHEQEQHEESDTDVNTGFGIGATSSDEDIWWNAKDRFSDSSVKMTSSTLNTVNKQAGEESARTKFSINEKNAAALRHQSLILSTGHCKDTNLIYSVNRTLRESLAKFTGSMQTQVLMHLANSVLQNDELSEDYSPDISYSELEELKGDGTYHSSSTSRGGSAKMTPNSYVIPQFNTVKTPRTTMISSGTMAQERKSSCAETQTNSAVGKSRHEILKVLKDSQENIKLEFNMGKNDHPKLAEFVSQFIDSQRAVNKSQVEANTQTHGCLQCGRKLVVETEESIRDRMTTNNNRSSTPCSPIRSPSPLQRKPFKSVSSDLLPKATASASTTKSLLSNNSSIAISFLQSASSQPSSVQDDSQSSNDPETPRSLSPDTDYQSEGNISPREGDEDFSVTKFLNTNNMYRKLSAKEMELPFSSLTEEPSRKRSRGFNTQFDSKHVKPSNLTASSQRSNADKRRQENGKEVTNKGSFLGEMCGCH